MGAIKLKRADPRIVELYHRQDKKGMVTLMLLWSGGPFAALTKSDFEQLNTLNLVGALNFEFYVYGVDPTTGNVLISKTDIPFDEDTDDDDDDVTDSMPGD